VNHPLVYILVTYAVLLLLTGLYALLVMMQLRFRSKKSCLCPRCGRSERMKPYGHDARIKTRTAYLLYCGLVPGIIHYIWISRFYLCPHCLNVSSTDELDGRQVVKSVKKRRRRSRSHDSGESGSNG
jgi:hypothetical protein